MFKTLRNAFKIKDIRAKLLFTLIALRHLTTFKACPWSTGTRFLTLVAIACGFSVS